MRKGVGVSYLHYQTLCCCSLTGRCSRGSRRQSHPEWCSPDWCWPWVLPPLHWHCRREKQTHTKHNKRHLHTYKMSSSITPTMCQSALNLELSTIESMMVLKIHKGDVTGCSESWNTLEAQIKNVITLVQTTSNLTGKYHTVSYIHCI